MAANRSPAMVLAWSGLGVTVIGLVLVFVQQWYDFRLQRALADKLAQDYIWRPIGEYYAGLSVVAIGALMMIVAAVAAHRQSGPGDKPPPTDQQS